MFVPRHLMAAGNNDDHLDTSNKQNVTHISIGEIGDFNVKHQFVVGVCDEWVRHDLRRLVLMLSDKPFIAVREEALCLLCEEEASVVEMRPVEKVA